MLNTSSGQTALGGLEKKLTGSVPDDSEVPGPVRKAVRLMLSGGAVTAVLGLFLVIAMIADKNGAIDANGKKLTSSEFTGSVVGIAFEVLLLVVIWVLMARMNRAGRGWARFVASGLAAIYTYYAFGVVNGLKGGQTVTVLGIVSLALNLVLWIIGVVAVAMLWRSESSAYFRSRAAAR